MIGFLSGLGLGLVLLLIAWRRWVRTRETLEFRMRETEAGADVVAGFAGGLLALARERPHGSEVADAVLILLAEAVGATSAALHTVDGAGMLRRVAVRGLHPRQSPGGGQHDSRASVLAEDMGPETIGTDAGVVGAAALAGTTVVWDPDEGRPAQVAIPVIADGRLTGVVSVAGPDSGGAFTARAVALAERLAIAAAPVLGQEWK